MPTSIGCLPADAGFNGCAAVDQTEQGHITVKGTDCDAPSSVAVSATDSSDGGATLAAETAKVAVDDSAGTTTAVGVTKAGPPAESDTVAPPLGAAPEIVTVHVLPAPALRLVGLHAREVTSKRAIRLRVAV